MATYTYGKFIATDDGGNLVRNAVGNVYDPADTTYSTPLTVFDLTGNPITTINTDAKGYIGQQFTCDIAPVIWKSGSYPPVEMWSAQMFSDYAQQAAADAQTAADAAAAAQAAAEAAASGATAPTSDAVNAVLVDTTSTARSTIDNLYLGRSSRLKHAVALGVYYPEAEGAGLTDDDSSAFVAAMNAAIAAGGVVQAAAPVYNLKTLLNIPAGAVILGTAKSLVTLKLTDVSRAIGIRLNGAARMERVTVDINRVATSYGVQIAAAADKSILRDCAVTDSQGPNGTGTGIQVNAACKITDCEISNAGTSIQITSAPAGVHLERNTLTKWSQRGIYVLATDTAACSDVWLTANRILDLCSPQDVYGASPTPTQLTTFQGYAHQPIAIQGSDVSFITGLHILSNNVRGPGTSADDPARPGTADQISVHQTDGGEVRGNYSVDGGDVGITVAVQCKNITVADNICERNDSSGLCIGSSNSQWTRNITVTNNTCTDNGQNRLNDGPQWASNGINLQLCDGVIVSNNRCGDSFPSNAWAASHAYQVGDRVYLPGNQVMRVTVAGTSGSSAPAAPAVGATVTDGGVTWAREQSTQTKKTQQYGIAIQNSPDVTIGPNKLTGNAIDEFYTGVGTSANGSLTFNVVAKPLITAADQTVNNSTTLVTSALSWPIMQGGTYEVEAFLIYNATSTADFNIKFNGPAGAALSWVADGPASTAATAALITRTPWVIGSTATLGGVGSNTSASPKGILTVGSTSGSLSLSFAQNTAEATDAILRAGSWLKLRRIA